MKGDENRYLVLGKADVDYDLPKNLQKSILSKDNLFLSVEENAIFFLEVVNLCLCFCVKF